MARVRRLIVFDAIPVFAIGIYGLGWIVLHASSRGVTHSVFQLLALTENLISLLFRRQKPLISLAAILVVYLAVDLEPLTLAPAVLALLTVVMCSRARTVAFGAAAWAAVVIGMPFLHGDRIDDLSFGAIHLAVLALIVGAGVLLRQRAALTR